MTVQRIVTPNRFIGKSSDTKPTEATHPGRVRIGDTFYERDTGLLFITYNGTDWVEKASVMHGIRADAEGSLASADGDASPLQFDHRGNLRVTSPMESVLKEMLMELKLLRIGQELFMWEESVPEQALEEEES